MTIRPFIHWLRPFLEGAITETAKAQRNPGASISYNILYFPDLLTASPWADPDSREVKNMREHFLQAIEESTRLFAPLVTLDPFGTSGGSNDLMAAGGARGCLVRAHATLAASTHAEGSTFIYNAPMGPPPEYRRRHTSPLPFRKPPPTENGVQAPVLPQLHTGEPHWNLPALARRQTIPYVYPLIRAPSLAYNSGDQITLRGEDGMPDIRRPLLRPSSAASHCDLEERGTSTTYAGTFYGTALPRNTRDHQQLFDADGRRTFRTMSLQLRRDPSLPAAWSGLPHQAYSQY